MSEKCREAALKLFSFKDRTEAELCKRLAEKGFDEREIAETMAFAVEYGYIDDRRYAQRYISDGINLRGHGFGRIKTELLRKGIDRLLVEEEIALAEEAEADPRERIAEIIDSRFANADLGSQRERNRIFGYFARRGYAPRDIWGVINDKSAFKDVYWEED